MEANSRDYRSPDLFGEPSLLSKETLADIEAAPTSVLQRLATMEPTKLHPEAELELISRALIELARRKTASTQPRMQAVRAEIAL